MIEMPHLPDEVRASLPPVAQAYIPRFGGIGQQTIIDLP